MRRSLAVVLLCWFTLGCGPGLAFSGTPMSQAGIGPATQLAATLPGRLRKHPIYYVLDALILSSPLTAITSIALFMDPELRDRPAGLFRFREVDRDGIRLLPGVRRRVIAKLVFAIGTGAAAGAGVLTLLLHLLNLIPKID